MESDVLVIDHSLTLSSYVNISNLGANVTY